MLNRFHAHVSRNLPQIIFLAVYFLTIVFANVIYATPMGPIFLERIRYPTALYSFPESFTAGFWTLLFLPFLVTPIVTIVVRRCMRPLQPLLFKVPEIARIDYLVASSLCVAFVVFLFWNGGALTMFLQGKNDVSSVEARFDILNIVGFKGLVALHSLLWFLSVYAFVRAFRERNRFWIGAFSFTFVVVSILLTMLNMKWPVLIFYAALVVVAFVYSSRPYLASMIGVVALIGCYVAISSFVYRLAPDLGKVEARVIDIGSDPGAELFRKAREQKLSEGGSVGPTDLATAYIAEALENLAGAAPTIALGPFQRMAVSFGYYYQVFTAEGAVCGGVLAQAQPGVACRPSTLIYTRIFPHDKLFAGRGTSPTAVHVSAYALGGWPMAVLALVLASIVLGIFSAPPLGGSSTLGALFVTGTVAGYHFSQLPGEGPLFYDHGIAWSLALVSLLIGWRPVMVFLGVKGAGPSFTVRRS